MYEKMEPAVPNKTTNIIGMSGPAEIPVEMVNQIVSLMEQQAGELAQRCASVAQYIAGPQAESAEKPQQPQCLLQHLRIISNLLGKSLSEIERAQRAL